MLRSSVCSALFFRLGRLLLLGVTLFVPAGGLAPAGTIRLAPDPTQDLGHTIQARRLLLEDPDLAPLNLGVRVRNRVATLWGPVPSADLALKAELRLRAL